MENYVFEVFNDIDFEYFFILGSIDLIMFAYTINEIKFKSLALKLHPNFIEPILKIISDNYHYEEPDLTDYSSFKIFYDTFLANTKLKTKNFVNKNIDMFEIIFLAIHNHTDKYFCVCSNYVCDCKEKCKCCYYEYCCKNKTALGRKILKHNTLYYIKHFYLLQKHIKNKQMSISAKTIKNILLALEFMHSADPFQLVDGPNAIEPV